ncbi:MAG: sugar transferase [Acidobacteriota bacterium]|jgi:lipopolysaccharide/colanic/teichoic acid biosynthesis glycosyltransferase|nr:sugar transferase [Acidobacteriota bacterium]
MKRLFDILAAAVGLVVLSPLLLVVALVILVADGWPVLFLHERVGRNGRMFRLVKFRTMTDLSNDDRNGFTPGERKRVTAIGRFLRRAKMDELPQLWNVLVGDMSMVGPRPEVRKWTAVYPERWALVHTLRPGITDPAAIAFRNEEEILAAADDPEQTYRSEILPKKLDMYETYVKTRSFGGDLKLICRTLQAVLHGSP